MRTEALGDAQPQRLQGQSAVADERHDARGGIRGLLVAICLGLAAWLATGVAVALALLR